MADYSIEAEVRTVTGKKVKTIRNQGFVPITVYGAKIKPTNLQIPYRKLETTLMEAGGTALIEISADKQKYIVLARDVQRDVLKGTILHADFFAVDETSTIRAEIPVNLIGESPAVEARIGILLAGTNTITIEALPGKLMRHIDVDLSSLKEIGDAITVADIVVDEGVIIINDPEETLARVSHSSAARAEEAELEEGEELEGDMGGSAEPEVISKGKSEEDEEV